MKLKLLIIATAILAVAVGTAAAGRLAQPSPEPKKIVEVVVRPGDTAWQLCAKANGDSVDVRLAVWYFEKLNGQTAVRAWETVKVPVF